MRERGPEKKNIHLEMVKKKKKTFSVPDGCATVVKNEGERERESRWRWGGEVGNISVERPV